MSKALVIGNGKSRAWFRSPRWVAADDVVTWGCNAIYRERPVDNLVAMDNAMKFEIHASGYPKKHQCWFSSWNVIDSTVWSIIKHDCGVPEYFIHESEDETPLCVINEYKSNTLQDLVNETLTQNPHYNMDDVSEHLISKNFRYKDAGYWVSYVSDQDKIVSVNEQYQSAGCAALSLACQEGAEEVYMIGFDMEDSDSLYRGTANYVSENMDFGNEQNLLSKWATCLDSIFDKYKDVSFYWVDCRIRGQVWHGTALDDYHLNVGYLTKNELCAKINIL
tara:strand:- start:1206 stop:2039 length:834 start_codon:yes stop_codon:yes gene_type:complete